MIAASGELGKVSLHPIGISFTTKVQSVFSPRIGPEECFWTGLHPRAGKNGLALVRSENTDKFVDPERKR